MIDSQNKSAQPDATREDKAEDLNHHISQSDSYYYDDATGYEIYHDQEENADEDSKGDKK